MEFLGLTMLAWSPPYLRFGTFPVSMFHRQRRQQISSHSSCTTTTINDRDSCCGPVDWSWNFDLNLIRNDWLPVELPENSSYYAGLLHLANRNSRLKIFLNY